MPYEFSGFLLDERLYELRAEGVRVPLKRQSFNVLFYLLEHRDRVVPKQELFSSLWGRKVVVENVISQAIAEIRRALGDRSREPSVIETIHGRGFRFIAEARPVVDVSASPRPDLPASSAFLGRPAVAVLPFVVADGRSEHEYFAHGLTDDLITRLAAWRFLPIIDRGSTFTYERTPLDAREVGRELCARYVVAGRVRRDAHRIRVHVHLTDASTGEEIWAQRYDGEPEDIFEVQEQIVSEIGAELPGAVLSSASLGAFATPTESFDAWDHALRGLWHYHRTTESDNERAIAHFEAASRQDPRFALPLYYLGHAHYLKLLHQWGERDSAIASMRAAAQETVRADPRSPMGSILFTYLHMLDADNAQAIRSIRAAIEANPSLAHAHSLHGQLLALSGHPKEGMENIERAIRLSPRDRGLDGFHTAMAIACFMAGDYERAIEWCESSLAHNPALVVNHACIVACHALLGDVSEVKRAAKVLREAWPQFSSEGLLRLLRASDPVAREAFQIGLARAGFV